METATDARLSDYALFDSHFHIIDPLFHCSPIKITCRLNLLLLTI
jgi:hypothetical protein